MTPEEEAAAAAEKARVEADNKQQGQTFTQAEVNQIVQDRLKQQAQNKFGDYDELKTKAAGAQTLEERLGLVEKELTTTKAEALRSRIAAEFGISTKPAKAGEPSDADLFLTGSDEASLIAQAQRLAGREADRKKQGNVAPKEGATKTTGSDDHELREFARNLFDTPD